MSNFVEERFPTDISFGSTGGPEFKTIIVENQCGNEIRQVNFNFAKHSYDITFGPKNNQHIDKILSFFHNRLGQAIGFRFKDWGDYQICNQQIGLGNGAQTEFQIYKTYSTQHSIAKRIITKPVEGTLSIKNYSVNEYECNFAKGIVKFYKAPPADTPIIISVEFDIPVRFATDKLAVKVISHDLRELQTVKLIEITS